MTDISIGEPALVTTGAGMIKSMNRNWTDMVLGSGRCRWNGISFLPPPLHLPQVEFMGCWSVVRASVVPGPMGPLRRGSVDSGEGAHSHNSRMQCMGRGMGQEAGGVSLRQPSRSGEHTLEVK